MSVRTPVQWNAIESAQNQREKLQFLMELISTGQEQTKVPLAGWFPDDLEFLHVTPEEFAPILELATRARAELEYNAQGKREWMDFYSITPLSTLTGTRYYADVPEVILAKIRNSEPLTEKEQADLKKREKPLPRGLAANIDNIKQALRNWIAMMAAKPTARTIDAVVSGFTPERHNPTPEPPVQEAAE